MVIPGVCPLCEKYLFVDSECPHAGRSRCFAYWQEFSKVNMGPILKIEVETYSATSAMRRPIILQIVVHKEMTT